MINTFKGFGIVNKAEIDFFFLELSCFFDDPADVGNLISGSSAFSKTGLNIWNFMAHVLLKQQVENLCPHKNLTKIFETPCVNIWGLSCFHLCEVNFMVHVLLKSGLENFEHYFTSM